jgi:hypothetical protein
VTAADHPSLPCGCQLPESADEPEEIDDNNPRAAWSCATLAFAPADLEDEGAWLRHRIMRMRTVLRLAKGPRAEAGMRELIADAEARLAALEASGHRR